MKIPEKEAPRKGYTPVQQKHEERRVRPGGDSAPSQRREETVSDIFILGVTIGSELLARNGFNSNFVLTSRLT